MQIRLQNILYPTDFSELSLHALSYARAFSDNFEATLHCIHVVDEAYQHWTALGPESLPMGPVVEDLMSVAKGQMAKFAEEHLTNFDRPVVTKVTAGRPFSEIIQYARKNDIDMIIMATHGRGGLRHILIGSEVERVVRKSPCPVLTVRVPGHDFVMP